MVTMRTFEWLLFSLLCCSSSPAAAFLPGQANPQQFFRFGQDPKEKSCSESISTYQRTGPLHVSTASSLSENLISQIAVLAIQVCLADYSDVTCDVSALPQNLFQGQIGPVTVKGKGWKSSRGLTCKAIEASVNTCKLDMNRVISDRKLVLVNPAEGKAMVAMTAEDFGNFITHPRLEKAKMKASNSAGLNGNRGSSSSPSGISFSKDNVLVDPTSGSVTFYASCAGSMCKCVLRRGSQTGQPGSQAIVDVTNVTGGNKDAETASRLAQVFTDFFNLMVFELYDGLLLSFRDMMVTDKGSSPSVLLSLNIRVEKFPSPAVRPSDF